MEKYKLKVVSSRHIRNSLKGAGWATEIAQPVKALHNFSSDLDIDL